MNLSNGLVRVMQEIEQEVAAVPIADLPAVLGALERIRVIGWARTIHGTRNGQAEDVLLTVPDVAKHLKLSSYRVYGLVRQGALKSIHLGKSVRVRPAAVAEYLAHQEA